MKAMVLEKLTSLESNQQPLTMREVPMPVPDAHEVLVQVHVCGVCHTDLDEIEGRTAPPELPVILGHQVVGTVAQTGEQVSRFRIGDRVGVAWIFSACKHCEFCLSGKENLCASFKATGRDVNGGYAQFMKVPEDFAYHLPADISNQQAAPLLCAGAIGYRALQLSGLHNGQTLGLTGFGASAHLVLQMAKYKYPDSKIYVFARSSTEQAFALSLGADWAGDTQDIPPQLMNCLIDTTPVWKPIVAGLEKLKPGGRLVINAIRKEETDKNFLLQLQYEKHLWLEKEIKSVANITRTDVEEFLALAALMHLQPEIQAYPLSEANAALYELKKGHIKGAKVLVID
jgi:alcohol dehydrogenase, propanol-preferring